MLERILSILITVCMILTLVPMAVFAEDTEEGAVALEVAESELDPELDPETDPEPVKQWFTLTVLDELDNPVVGVQARLYDDNLNDPPISQSVTDGSGICVLEKTGLNSFKVVLYKEGYDTSRVRSYIWGGNYSTTTVISTYRIYGVVKDENSNPLHDVNVDVYNTSNELVGHTKTDENGRYIVSGLNSYSYNVVMVKGGYDTYTGKAYLILGSSNLDVTLNKISTYESSGIVKDPDNKAAAGIQVKVIDTEDSSIIFNDYTDSDGKFYFNITHGHSYTINAIAEDFRTYATSLIDINEAWSGEIRLYHPQVSGTVVDKDNNPLSDVTVTVYNKDSGISNEVTTDESNWFSMDIPAGNIEVTATKDGYHTFSDEFNITGAGRNDYIINMERQLGYDITFNANGGTLWDNLGNPRDSITLKTDEEGYLEYVPNIDRADHRLLGWIDGEGHKLQINHLTKFDSDMVLDAEWEFIGYTLSLDLNYDGMGLGTIQTGKDSKLNMAELPIPSRDGHTFLGWFTEGTGGKQIDGDHEFTSGGSIYAHWDFIGYEVTFDARGGVLVGESTITTGKNGMLTTFPSATKTGHKFIRWETEYGTEVDEALIFTEKQTVYAVWEPETSVVKYKVTFNLNYAGSIPIELETDTAGVVTGYIADPTRTGYQFSGWYYDEACIGENYIISDTVTEDTIVYASWVPMEATVYQIQMDLNYGTPPASYYLSTNTDGRLDAVDTPVREGYRFLGWYNARIEGAYINIETEKFKEDTVLYARWELKEAPFTIIFDANGGVLTVDGEKFARRHIDTNNTGKVILMPENPTRAGYKFLGWFKESGEEVRANTSYIDDTTVLAQWSYTGGSSSSDGSSSSGSNNSVMINNNNTSKKKIEVNKSKAVEDAKKAIAAAGKTGEAARIRTVNASKVSFDTMKAVSATGNVMIHADTMNGNAIQGRLYIDPSKATGDIKLGVYTTPDKTGAATKLFNKFFSNTIEVVSFEQKKTFGTTVRVAAKIDTSKLNTNNLIFYCYDKETNTYHRIYNPSYSINAHGYVHFNTTYAGDIIITDRALKAK